MLLSSRAPLSFLANRVHITSIFHPHQCQSGAAQIKQLAVYEASPMHVILLIYKIYQIDDLKKVLSSIKTLANKSGGCGPHLH